MKLLYAEDERSLSEAVVDILKYHNFNVDPVYNGDDALAYAQSEDYDGIILDIMMPGLDGIEVLKKLREGGCTTPVLMLTAKSMVEDQIAGLDAGADDYLPKPFSMELLIARVRAMLRRKENYTSPMMTYGNVCLDQMKCELSVDEEKVALVGLEYKLMECLMLNSNRYMSSEDLLTNVWGYDTEAELGTVWVHISYLRKHLKNLGADVVIDQKRNTGYKLAMAED